jgi:hypothetical protein
MKQSYIQTSTAHLPPTHATTKRVMISSQHERSASLVFSATIALLTACTPQHRGGVPITPSGDQPARLVVEWSAAGSERDCDHVARLMASDPALLRCPDLRSCEIAAQQLFKSRASLLPRWQQHAPDLDGELIRLVPKAAIGSSPHASDEWLEVAWQDEYRPSFKRALAEGALKLAETRLDVNYDGRIERSCRESG